MKKINSNMLSLFWTQFFGAFNDNLFKSALIILITYKSVSLLGLPPSAMVAFCGGIFILPFFIASSFAGDISDRFNKIWLCHKIKEAEVLIALIGVVGIYLENYYLMVFVLFLLGVQSAFFGPIKYSLIPEFSEKENLVFSNALVSSGTFSAILLGTILGGLSVAKSGTHYNFIIGLVVFSLIGLYWAKKLKTNGPLLSNEKVKIEYNIFKSTNSCMKIISKDKKIFHLVMGLSWFWFLGAGLLSLIPTVAKNVYLGNESVATFMLFIFTVGMGVGPFILDYLTKGKVNDKIIPLSLLLMTIVLFDISYLVSFEYISSNELESLGEFVTSFEKVRFLIDLFLISLFGGLFTVPQFSKLQMEAEPAELSRIVAANNIINALAMVLVSVLIMGLAMMMASTSTIFIVLGVLNSIATFYLYQVYKKKA